MQKTNKTIFLITIVLVSLLCLTAASAASDDDAIAGDFPAVDIVAAESDVSVAASEDAQTVDNAYDDLSYEADDVIANSSSDAQSSLGSSPLGDSNTKTFSQLADDISSNPAMLSGAYYKYDADVDSDYANGITLTNGLTIIGGGATIDGNNMARIFNIPEGVSVTIMNLNLINGVADEGAAIYNSGKLTLMSSKVNDNTAVKSGAGIYNNNGEVLVTSCEFDGNDLTDRTHNGWGGAAIYSNQGTVTITDSNITNNLKNIVHRGGTGAYTGDLSSAAVTSEGGSLTVTNSYFKANSGSYGGAILANGGTLLVSGTTFEDNFAFNGGAIDIANADYTITNSKFIGNDAKGTGSGQTNYAHGGAIAAQDANNQGLISGCDFEGNTAAIGGAISTTNTVVTDSTFTNNNADAANSETYNGATNNRGGFGGAVYNDGTINIDGSEFTDNLGRGRGLDLKNAEISDSSFTNTIINVNNRGTVEVSNNQYDNDGKDISSTSGCTVMVNIEDGDVPYVTSGTIIYNGDMTFQDLQDIIDAGNTAITLGGNVVKSADEEITFADGLTINRSVTIYGNEKTITASTGKIFNVAEGKTLTLNGNTLVGSGETAIINHGTVSLGLASPNTFTNCGEAPIDNQGRTSQTGLTTFTQLSNLIALVNGGEIYIGSSKITKADGEDEIAIDKEITVTGYYSSYYKRIDTVINANNDGRVFNVAEGKTLTLNAINITNGAAEKGAGIYVSEGATLNANNVNFLNNVAEKRGGAIYSEGTVNIDTAIFDGNDITFRTKNDDNGGAAIYNLNGVLNLNNANITNNLKDIVIRNGNAGDLLVGVVVTSGETTIQNSYFANNTGSWGGAISSLGYMNDESYTLTVTGTTFEGNNATFGGAIFVESSNLVVDDCTFNNNKGVGVGSSGTSNTQGGAIVIHPSDSKATITNSRFNKNSANVGGAVSLAGVDQDSLIEGCTFTENTANDGGAIYLWTQDDAAVTVKGSTFSNGKAHDGAGVYVASGAKLDATSTTFKDNVATYSGGAIYTEGGVISLTDSILDGNDVTDYTKNNDTGGAAIYANNSATVTLVNTNVTNNGNKELNRTKGDLVNAVINLIDSDLTVTDCVFENNTGIYGGAIATQAPSGEKTLAISTSNFTSNAAYTGGAVYVGPNVKFTIEYSIFDANNKATGEGSTGYTSGGGAIQILDAGEGTIDHVIIKNSQATQAGAIGIEGSAPVTIKDSTFENNVATSVGGAIYAATDATLTVTGSTFTDNDAPFGSAISNDGALTLSGNTFTGGSTVAIANYFGEIKSEVFVKILDGQIVITTTASNEITAVLTDDNNNPIIDKTLVLIVNNEEVETAYNRVTGVMTGSYTFTAPGTYEVTAKDFDAEHTTSGTLVYTAGTYTELQNLIDAAEAGATIKLADNTTYDLAGIELNNSVTIVGGEGTVITVPAGQSSAFVAAANASDVNIKNIKFVATSDNQSLLSVTPNDLGGGISQVPAITIENVTAIPAAGVNESTISLLNVNTNANPFKPSSDVSISKNIMASGVNSLKTNASALSGNVALKKAVQTTLTGANTQKVYAIPYKAAKSGKYYTVTLKDKNGNVLTNKTVKFTLAGKTYTVKTDAKGVAKLAINIYKPGTYKLAVSFAGESTLGASSKQATIKILKNKVKITRKTKKVKRSAKKRTLKYYVKTKTGKKMGIKGVKVYLKINKKTYKAKTNKKGLVKFKVKLPRIKKTYKVKVTFKGNKANKKRTLKTKVKVY